VPSVSFSEITGVIDGWTVTSVDAGFNSTLQNAYDGLFEYLVSTSEHETVNMEMVASYLPPIPALEAGTYNLQVTKNADGTFTAAWVASN
jgi:hypothetical protein